MLRRLDEISADVGGSPRAVEVVLRPDAAGAERGFEFSRPRRFPG